MDPLTSSEAHTHAAVVRKSHIWPHELSACIILNEEIADDQQAVFLLTIIGWRPRESIRKRSLEIIPYS